ncbi:ExbD/TolR family protein [Intestinicryptomonas porci]|uniref:Biopolymer transporter ExbD n=1 Tax=Intestinicryptomonas porci TaxID=2926320 RepID=A0ABU4WGT4_9BACT|nr:biopolymer transporter ExbD [Opitutales bacterium CLA-KB-P66]
MDSLERSRRRRRKFEVNIVPMVDVMTVLIFFFLLTMQFKENGSVQINPPSMSTTERADENAKPTVLAVSKDGEFYLNEKKMPIEEISETLKKTAESDKGAAVLLLGDELAKYGDIAKAVDCVRAANIKKLRIRALQKKQ